MHKRFWSTTVVTALLSLALIAYVLELTSSANTSHAKQGCPKITIECPTELVAKGNPHPVSVNIVGADNKEKLSYQWSVSNGEIVEGQGTTSIKVRVINSYEPTKVTIKVCGLGGGCQNTTWCSFIVQ